MTYFYNGLFGSLDLGSQHFQNPGEYEVLEETTNHFFWGFMVTIGVFTKIEKQPEPEVTPEIAVEPEPEVPTQKRS